MLSADQLATKAGGIKNGTRLSRKHRQKEGPVAAAQVDIGTSEDYKFIKVGTIVAQLRTYVAAKNGQGIAVSVGQEVEANPLPALSPYTNYQKLDTYAFSVEVGGKIYQVVTREAVPNQP